MEPASQSQPTIAHPTTLATQTMTDNARDASADALINNTQTSSTLLGTPK
jgi:hypothetical protein